jgi:UDP-glucose 4-epimerase
MNVKKTVLVTGGAGYIGAHTCKVLSQFGFIPVTYDNLCQGHRSAVKWGPLEIGDISDQDRLKSVFDQFRPVAVIHFAAFAYVGESVDNPEKYYLNNVVGTLKLLNAMRNAGIDKIIFSSSCSTYGIPEKIPITEDHPQNPINPYGRSKLMIESVMSDYAISYGLKYVALRYFNAAGADPQMDIGENHNPETHLIPSILDAVIGRRQHINIFGKNYDTPDGTCIRDYIHVSDLADAHVLSLKYLLDGGESDIYNLGNGSGFSVKEVIETAVKITGLDIDCAEKDKREGDPPILIGCADKIKKELMWKPKLHDLETIIYTAWQWHKKLYGFSYPFR